MRSIFKILMQGLLEENSNGIPTRASQKDLYKILQIFLEDFTRIQTGASHKDLYKTLTKIFMRGPLRESQKIVIKGPAAAGENLTRSWYKSLPREPQKSFIQAPLIHGICKIFMQEPLSGSYQDPHKIFLTRTCTRSRTCSEDLLIEACADHARTNQDPHQFFRQGSVQVHARTAWRGLHQDVHKILS